MNCSYTYNYCEIIIIIIRSIRINFFYPQRKMACCFVVFVSACSHLYLETTWSFSCTVGMLGFSIAIYQCILDGIYVCKASSYSFLPLGNCSSKLHTCLHLRYDSHPHGLRNDLSGTSLSLLYSNLFLLLVLLSLPAIILMLQGPAQSLFFISDRDLQQALN